MQQIKADNYLLLSPIEGLLAGILPESLVTVNEWADEKRILPPESAVPGPFQSSKTPYIKEIAEKLSASNPAQKIIWMKSAQVGATELGNNWLGYTIDVDPAPMLYIMPTDSIMKTTSKNRIQKMIDTTETLRKKVKSARTRDSGNTLSTKSFPGGFVHMIGANSPVGLASLAIKKIYADEVDRYPADVGGEGDVISLAITRTTTFGETRKIFITSTPTLAGTSIVHKEIEKTGQRHFHFPCPHCGGYQKYLFEQLKWKRSDYASVAYQCVHCGDMIAERHKTKMLDAGEWKPDFPEKEDGFVFGYLSNAMISPLGWYSWAQMAKESDEAEGDIPKTIVFVNTKLGLCYEAEGDSPPWESVYNKRENYPTNKPNNDVIFITAGVDIQKDRIEVEIVGWGTGKQSWSIDYRVLLGNTESVGNDAWKKLQEIVNESWIREDGAVLPLYLMAVDSGNNTAVVYDWCSRYPTTKVIPIKGRDSQTIMVAQPRQVRSTSANKKINETKVWNVAVSIIKTELYGWLNLQRLDNEPYPKGYCHFPMYDEQHFRSLTAEKLTYSKNKKGYPITEWKKHYERNERLDCRVYARAAAYVIGIDKLTDLQWLEKKQESLQLIPQPEIPEVKKKKETGGSDYWSRH